MAKPEIHFLKILFDFERIIIVNKSIILIIIHI